jgi:hypothetical protein
MSLSESFRALESSERPLKRKGADDGVVYGCSSPTGGCTELVTGECYSNPDGTYLACE